MGNLKLKKQQRPQRICIFCRRKPCSKEHFWPQWADDILPHPEPRQNVEVFFSRSAPGTLKSSTSKTRDGNVQTKKIRAVCKPCNNGWMSVLEKEARPILTPMIKGEAVTLTSDMQAIAVRWIVMKMIVGEHNRPIDAVTTYDERSEFKETGQIPSNLRIWLGHCGQGGWETAYKRETHTVSRTRNPDPRDIANKNVQEVAFGIGHLFVHIFHTTVENIGVEFTVEPKAIVQLWPTLGTDIRWPPDIRLSGIDAGRVATVIQQITRSPRSLWLPWPQR